MTLEGGRFVGEKAEGIGFEMHLKLSLEHKTRNGLLEICKNAGGRLQNCLASVVEDRAMISDQQA